MAIKYDLYGVTIIKNNYSPFRTVLPVHRIEIHKTERFRKLCHRIEMKCLEFRIFAARIISLSLAKNYVSVLINLKL